jgi:hypothetical protein
VETSILKQVERDHLGARTTARMTPFTGSEIELCLTIMSGDFALSANHRVSKRVFAMKYTILVAVSALVAGAAATAHAEDARSLYTTVQPANPSLAASNAALEASSTAASLQALLADWDRLGFTPPSKPSQYRVYGRNGYVTDGPGYNAMVSLIRSALRAAQQGRDNDAAVQIAKARGLLAKIASPTPGPSNG